MPVLSKRQQLPMEAIHIIVMQKQKNKLYKNACFHLSESTTIATSSMAGFPSGHCDVSGQFSNSYMTPRR